MANPIALSIGFTPDHSPKPSYYSEQQFIITVRATQVSDGAPIAVTGLTLKILRPDNSTLVFAQNQMTTVSTGVYEASVIPGSVFGNWRALAACTGPFQTRTREAFRVQADGVDPPPAPTPFLVTADLATPVTQAGGLLTVKRMSELEETSDATNFKVLGVQNGASKLIGGSLLGTGVTEAEVLAAGSTYVIQNVGVPVTSYVHGTTVLPDDTTAISNGITVGRAFGFTRIATVGVVVGLLGVVTNIKGTILTNSVGIDVQDAVSGASGYHKLPHWQFGPNAKIVGTGGAMRTEDFLAISTGWTPVSPGTDPVLDDRAQRDALTHQIRGYAGSCIEWQGDGNALIRTTLLGFIDPWWFDKGGRHHWDTVMIDVGGTMERYGVGFRLTRSGGAPRGRAAHVVTLGIKNVVGVNALDHVILAAEQVTSGPHTGKTRIRIGVCYYTKFKLWAPGGTRAGQVSKGDVRVVNYSADPLNVSLHAFEVKRRGDWIAGQTAPGTGTTLTEAHIGQTFSDGAVEWVYLGPYTGIRFNADRPAAYLLDKDTNPAGAWGHRVIVNVLPEYLYDPTDFDPRVRGHYEVLAKGAQAADQAEFILDLPWQSSFATTLPTGHMSVYPGMRIAKSIEASGDGGMLEGWTSKAALVAGDIDMSNCTILDGSNEEASEGEYSLDNCHSVGWLFRRKGAGCVLLGGGHKNVGYCMIIDTGQDQPVEYVAKESSGGKIAGIWVKSGTLKVSGGHMRGFAMRIHVDEDGFADLSGLTTAAGLEITGTNWQSRVIMPRVGVAGPAVGRQVISGPGKIEIGETLATAPWAPLEVVTSGLRRKARGTQGDLWRLRCVTGGTTGAVVPGIMRVKKARENNFAYSVGKDLWLTGSDGNAHLVSVTASTGAGLSGASPPAVTDATVTIADGNLTLRRLGRYTGPGALVPDGTAVWAIEDIDLGVQSYLTFDPALGAVYGFSYTGGGAPNLRFTWDDTNGFQVEGLYHLGSARYVLSSRGDLRLRRRTLSQITTNDADPAAGGLTRLVLATDATGGEALAHATDNNPAVPYARQDYVTGITTPLTARVAALEDDAQVIVGAGQTLTLTRALHQGRTIILDGADATVACNATTQGAGFTVTIENHTGSAWAIPAFTGASALYSRGASHTSIYSASSAVVEVMTIGGTLRSRWTGDTYAP